MKRRTERADSNQSHYLTGQQAAVLLLAALIFCVLLLRYYRKMHFSAVPSPPPIVLDIQGDVKHVGVYVLTGEPVTILHSIIAAGGLSCGKISDIPTAVLHRTITTGTQVRITRNPRDGFMVQTEPAGGKLRLILGQKLDPNSATAEELMLIPAMKLDFARAIVQRRDCKPWQTVDELRVISGVGPKTVQKWKEYLEISQLE